MTDPIALKQVCRKLIVLGVVSELVADSVSALVVQIILILFTRYLYYPHRW